MFLECSTQWIKCQSIQLQIFLNIICVVTQGDGERIIVKTKNVINLSILD